MNLLAIKHFYQMNIDKSIDWKRVSKFLGENIRVHNHDRAYTHEEIQRMLNLANVKYKE